MRKHLVKTLAIGLILCMTAGCALADSVSLTGSVVCDTALTQTADYGGTVESVNVHVGDHVTAGDVLATIGTTKVYAEQDGTVRFFGKVGDNAETVATRYGAVAYVEPAIRYTISASTKNAYNVAENKIIHPGEKVWLATSASGHRGTGMVTSVDGSSYTVEILDGDIVLSETTFIYRDEGLTVETKIGKGTSSLASYATYSGTGLIAAYGAENGAEVKAGDVLFETVAGTWTGASEDLTVIRAAVDGIVSSLNISVGANLNEGDTVCEINPDDALRVEASAGESDLKSLAVGDEVQVEFTYVNNGEFIVPGTVERIGTIGTAAAEESEEATFTVSVELADITGVSYGLTAVVSTPEEPATEEPDEEPAESEEAAEEEPAEAVAEENVPAAPDGFPGTVPEGFDGQLPEGFDGQLPEGFPGIASEGNAE